MRQKLFFLALFVSAIVFSQNVVFNDVNFKNALLNDNPSIDANNDREISLAEAQNYTGRIYVSSRSIRNLQGIEKFVNITELFCDDNKLTSLNLANNTKLEKLDCGSNQLTSLNLSNNVNLKSLSCYGNFLTSLHLDDNTKLENVDCSYNNISNLTGVDDKTLLKELDCKYNLIASLNASNNSQLEKLVCSNQIGLSGASQRTSAMSPTPTLTSLNLSNSDKLKVLKCTNNSLTALDLTDKTSLEYLYCNENNLTSLNIANSHNSGLITFNSLNNPNLTCIQVDANIIGAIPFNSVWSKDAGASYSANCSLGIDDIELNSQEVSIYPNPVLDVLHVSLKHSDVKSVTVYNVLGAVVLQSTETSIGVQALPSGVYIVKVEDVKGRKFASKVVKK